MDNETWQRRQQHGLKQVLVTAADTPFVEEAVRVLSDKHKREQEHEHVMLVDPGMGDDVGVLTVTRNGEIDHQQPILKPRSPQVEPRREFKLHYRADPKNPFSTLPLKRDVGKNPEGLSGRQLKKARKQARRQAND